MDFVPFYRLHRRTYGIYWDLFTPPEWDQRAAEIAAEREKQRKLEAATVGFVQPGEMQAERDANMQGESTEPVRVMGRPGRRGTKWFSFDLPVDPAHPMALVVDLQPRRMAGAHVRDPGGRHARGRADRSSAAARCGSSTSSTPCRPKWCKGKQKVTVKFQATQGNEIGAVFGIRMIRADAQR